MGFNSAFKGLKLRSYVDVSCFMNKAMFHDLILWNKKNTSWQLPHYEKLLDECRLLTKCSAVYVGVIVCGTDRKIHREALLYWSRYHQNCRTEKRTPFSWHLYH